MCSQCEPTHWFHDWLKVEHLHQGLGREAVNEGSGDCERRASGAALATVWCGLITPRLSPPGPSRGSNLSARLNVAPVAPSDQQEPMERDPFIRLSRAAALRPEVLVEDEIY